MVGEGIDGNSIKRCLSAMITGMMVLGRDFCGVSGQASTLFTQTQN